MIKRSLLFLGVKAVVLLAFVIVVSVFAQTDEDIILTNLWARPAGEGEVSAVYMTVENPLDETIRLTAAASDAAEIVEIHETTMEGGVMSMAPVEGGLVIEPGETAALEPGGLHVMLINLLTDLPIETAISLTLTFEIGDDTREMVVAAPILEESPENTPDFVIINSWARPTALMPMEDMDMGEAEGEGEDSDMGDMDMGMGDLPPSAAYMILTNRGEEDDTLIAATSPLIPIVEIHATEMDNDVMRMREIEEGIAIPAGESIVLEPGGFHIMLMNLEEDLFPGNAIPLTLTFESGREITIAVPVRDEFEMEMDM